MSDELVRRKLFRASPAGRLEVHLINVAGLERIASEMPEGFDFTHYLYWVELAADRNRKELLSETLHFLARADAALARLEHEWDSDRIRGVKQRGNQLHPTGPTQKTEDVVRKMRPLIASGYSQRRAAKAVTSQVKGSSEEGNLQAWKRWGRKTED